MSPTKQGEEGRVELHSVQLSAGVLHQLLARKTTPSPQAMHAVTNNLL